MSRLPAGVTPLREPTGTDVWPGDGAAQNPLLRLPAVGDNAAMEAEASNAELSKQKVRYFSLTRDGLLVCLLAVEAFILLAENFRWFAFDKNPVRTVQIAFAGVAAAAIIVWLSRLVIARRIRGLRWYQFSLRSFLIVTVICALASAWIARQIERKRNERESVEAIVKLGGWVVYDYVHDGKAANPPGPAWLRKLVGDNFFGEVVYVSLGSNSKVTGADWAKLEQLPDIETLDLSGSDVTDDDLVHLKGFSQLQGLRLVRTKVSDAGLEHLKGLTNLQWISVNGTRIAATGAKEFHKALPNCTIVF
jgi:hypothetical protein